MCLLLSVFVTLTILAEFFRGARVIAARTGSNIFSSAGAAHHAQHAALRRLRRPLRHGAGLYRHFRHGIQSRQADGHVGRLADEHRALHICTCRITTPQQEPNYSAERATIDVDKDGRSVMMLYPTRRFYPSNQESGTMVAISSTLREDLYVVYAGTNPDTNLPVIHAYLNPLVKWIWLGGVVVVLGTILALAAEPPGRAW